MIRFQERRRSCDIKVLIQKSATKVIEEDDVLAEMNKEEEVTNFRIQPCFLSKDQVSVKNS